MCWRRPLQNWSPDTWSTENAVLEDQGRGTKFQDLLLTLRTQSRAESVIVDLNQTGVFNTFSDDSKTLSKNGGRSNYLNWDKFLRKYSARPASSTDQKDCFTALAEYVYDLRKNRNAMQRNNFKSCQFLISKKNSRTISKRRNQRDMRKRKTFRLLRKDFRMMNCTETFQLAIGWTEETLSTFGIAHSNWFLTYGYAKRTSPIWTQLKFNVIGQGPKHGLMKKGTDYSQTVKKSSGSVKINGESKSVYPSTLTIPTVTHWRRWKTGIAMETLGMSQLISIFFLLFNLMDVTISQE